MSNLKNYQLEVEKLIAEENWSRAYEICNKILGYDPENTTFIKFKRNIEKTVSQINSDAIKQQFKDLEHLIKEKKYAEYLKEVSPLQTYVTQFPEIGIKILKVKKLLDNEYHEKRETAYQELVKEIQNNKGKMDYLDIINKLETFAKLGIHQHDVENWIHKVKNQYINSEIQKRSGLIKSQKFEDILVFLLTLKKIDKKNQQILNLIKSVNVAYKDFNIENKKDYIFKTLEEMKTLYLTKKYDFCAELASRVLQIDENNQLAQSYLKKSKIKSNTISEKKIIKSIFQYYSDFPNTRVFQNKDYIKI